MAGLMARRGPDDSGSWSDPEGRLALGFRRLAVLDPSPAGHQPMVSGDVRSALVFNGEIYNFQALRGELEAAGVRFRSRSDSEPLFESPGLLMREEFPVLAPPQLGTRYDFDAGDRRW